MWERYCVNLHGICRDGHPDNSDHLCVHWDSVNEECALAKSILMMAEGQRMSTELLIKRIMDEVTLEKKTKAAEEEG